MIVLTTAPASTLRKAPLMKKCQVRWKSRHLFWAFPTSSAKTSWRDSGVHSSNRTEVATPRKPHQQRTFIPPGGDAALLHNPLPLQHSCVIQQTQGSCAAVPRLRGCGVGAQTGASEDTRRHSALLTILLCVVQPPRPRVSLLAAHDESLNFISVRRQDCKPTHWKLNLVELQMIFFQKLLLECFQGNGRESVLLPQRWGGWLCGGREVKGRWLKMKSKCVHHAEVEVDWKVFYLVVYAAYNQSNSTAVNYPPQNLVTNIFEHNSCKAAEPKT